MTTRKLVTRKLINKITPLENSDFLEVLEIGGWKIVNKKNQFKVGDTVIYVEVDSILPISPQYDFLRRTSYYNSNNIEGYRIRTIKLRGHISQGLVLPIELVGDVPEDEDLTELLGVVKYEPTKNYDTSELKEFPNYLIKTSAKRCQNVDFEDLVNTKFFVTEKLDGASITISIKNKVFSVCSRNMEVLEGNNIYWDIVRKHNLKEKFENLDYNFSIQGELVGPKIQNNKYKLKETELFVFNLYDIDDMVSLPAYLARSFAKELGLQYVPVISESYFVETDCADIFELISKADGMSALTSTLREGLVLHSTKGKFKVISNKYLLRND